VSTNVDKIKCDKCGNEMNRELPNITSTTEVREVVDPYTNTTWIKDQQDLLKKRKEDYYWEVEVPRFVEKYSIETCLEQGWLVYNDKGELVINKPPSKR
jgi:copper chaperone CopZ